MFYGGNVEVYASVRRYAAFHASPGCRGLAGSLPVQQMSVEEAGARPPCLICFPDFPRLRVLHARCRVCDHEKTTPCPHNGGVAVMVPVPGRSSARRMVWPEQAYLYDLAPTSIRV